MPQLISLNMFVSMKFSDVKEDHFSMSVKKEWFIQKKDQNCLFYLLGSQQNRREFRIEPRETGKTLINGWKKKIAFFPIPDKNVE